MNLLTLSWRYLWARPLAAVLNLILLTIGLASLNFVLLASAQLEQAFERDLAGIDVVVGAKGSPMQLILAGVFHIDVAPGNVPLSDVVALREHPQVSQVIPLSLGDSFRGFRIVGSSQDYLKHYEARFAEGAPWTAPMQVVLGQQVASATGLRIGDHFHGSHGLGPGGPQHGDEEYLVVGRLAPCACVLDRLVLTATESVWQVHEGHSALSDAERKAREAGREVTLALVRYSTPMAAVSFPRHVNSNTRMQAAAPALELTRLLQMVGVGTDVLRAFAAVLLLSAGLSVFIALWNAVRERQTDLAMLRMLGAPPLRVSLLVLLEGLWLALLASAVGLPLGHALTAMAGYALETQRSLALSGWAWTPWEAVLPLLAAGIAALAASLPALRAYSVDVSQLLESR